MRKRLFWLVLTLPLLGSLAGAACTTAPPQVNLGNAFILLPGARAAITGEGLTVRFLDVTEDSRCPSEVVCIQAGQAVARVELESAASKDMALLTEVGGGTGLTYLTYREYTLAFRITPYPVSTQSIAANAYRLELTVTK